MKKITSDYLSFIGFTAEAKADLETLKKIHLLHTFKFPFENLTPFSHQEVILTIEAVADKFLYQGRGGYCFEQNLLFSYVLEDLGFELKKLGARVLWNQAEDLITRKSHMLLIVTVEGVEYLADVGFGGKTLTSPLIFTVGIEQPTTHEPFRIGRLAEDYKLEVKVNEEWKTLYRFDLQEQYPIDYDVANYYLYTHPTSIFRNSLIVAMPYEQGRVAISNNQLSIYELSGEVKKKTLKGSKELKDTLENLFKIRVPENEILEAKFKELASGFPEAR
jgi:N-hydroxyarylamine O-acetyltransferase